MKTTRRKYRFPDRQSAELAEASARNELCLLLFLLNHRPEVAAEIADHSYPFEVPQDETEYRIDVVDRKYCAVLCLWQTPNTGTRNAPRLLWVKDDTDAAAEYRSACTDTACYIRDAIDDARRDYHKRCASL